MRRIREERSGGTLPGREICLVCPQSISDGPGAAADSPPRQMGESDTATGSTLLLPPPNSPPCPWGGGMRSTETRLGWRFGSLKGRLGREMAIGAQYHCELRESDPAGWKPLWQRSGCALRKTLRIWVKKRNHGGPTPSAGVGFIIIITSHPPPGKLPPDNFGQTRIPDNFGGENFGRTRPPDNFRG